MIVRNTQGDLAMKQLLNGVAIAVVLLVTGPVFGKDADDTK
jgi:hypothetical protein